MEFNRGFSVTINGAGHSVEATFDVVNPASEEVIARAPDCGAVELDLAVAAARAAFPAWKRTPVEDRAKLIKEIGTCLSDNAAELAALLTSEQGKPLSAAKEEIEGSAYWCNSIAGFTLPTITNEDSLGRLSVTRRVPIGVVGAIVPWNYPMLLAIWKIAPALLAGNTVIVKPSPFTPLTMLKLGELLRDVLPAGTFNVVTGRDHLGPLMTAHSGIDKLSFTGSTATGKKVIESAIPTLKRVTLELGGNDAAIVLPDVDVDAVAEKVFWAAFSNSGQICIATKRLYVHDDIYERMKLALTKIAQSVKMGEGTGAGIQLGPVQNSAQFAKVKNLIEVTRKAGYKFVTGGEVPEGPGYFVPVTIVDNPPESSEVVQKEAFGPVLPLLRFSDIGDVIRRANDTDFGLGASVWSGDEELACKIASEIEAGTVWVNEIQNLSPFSVFGGHKQSGLGVENGVEGLLEYTNPQTISLGRQKSRWADMPMHPRKHAQKNPDKPAQIMASSGLITTYAQLEARSNQGAHMFRSLGLRRGDVIALQIENHPNFLDIAWAAQRSGLCFVCISSHFGPGEASYILKDSGARLLITSPALAAVAAAIHEILPELQIISLDQVFGDLPSYQDLIKSKPETPIEDESPGGDMLYSSGTTGRPKGVWTPLPDGPLDTPPPITGLACDYYGFDENTVYLCPAPLYHAAPLRWSMLVQRLGGTVILMEKFDPELALQSIERYKVTAAQWVPTHFIRLLKLPEEIRRRYDVSSLKAAIHAAAPCPVPIKRAMIEWWGPIFHEYYAGTEANGLTGLNTEEWLKKPGSVGRSIVGEAKICNQDGEPLPPGEEGLIYFANGNPFEYHNDPVRTAESHNRYGWTTLGDIGRLDEEGYLYLTDRKSFTIISGGVNIYPREIEDILITHPGVSDAAVIGVPDDEMGERIVAVIEPADWEAAGPALADDLKNHVRKQLSGIKVPRQIEFMRALPRHPNGKMYKRQLKEMYWPQN